MSSAHAVSPDTKSAIKLKVLIADDSATDRLILKRLVMNEGHETFEAENGKLALDLFSQFKPDLVLLDALMPEMDGFETACKIKALANEKFVPIIFLTSLTDTESLVRCLKAGGDDFLTKPYNRVILKAKIVALNRMREASATMQQQRDHIIRYNKQLIHEQEVAKDVFDNIAHPGCVDDKNIKYILSPMAVFNGDLLLASKTPSGNLIVFLGDFTGHGLPAAIGAMPVAEIFYGMSLKGFAIQEVLQEINRKLSNILPVGVFCCGCMAEMDYRKQQVRVWNGGLPDAVIYSRSGDKVTKIPSFNLPLGIIKPENFNNAIKTFDVGEGDRFYMSSDGILEEENSRGEMYGEEGFFRVFEENINPEKVFEEHKQAVNNFCENGEQGDDHSFVEIVFYRLNSMALNVDASLKTHKYETLGRISWSMSLDLRADALRAPSPVPVLMHILREIPALQSRSGELYTVLAELYFNALDHGVLGLDSALKSSTEGFSKYYTQREKGLKKLKSDSVKITLTHYLLSNGGVLGIIIEDSGEGFNTEEYLDKPRVVNGYCGRGISLVRSLCRSLKYGEQGNIVSAEYQWSNDPSNVK
ncbi:MAG: SpoIIE family protein phosphatase [Gammaproteobacteria bacterium]|nr:SpoIIE family protein phosphatase [Gammaproteobacteria bacterium]